MHCLENSSRSLQTMVLQTVVCICALWPREHRRRTSLLVHKRGPDRIENLLRALRCQRDAARRVWRCVAGLLAVCGQAPQLPNRCSLSLPGDILKHWVPFFAGPPWRSSATAGAETSIAPKAIVMAAIVNLCMSVPHLWLYMHPLWLHKFSVNMLSHSNYFGNINFITINFS